jgi:hypothetical protein
MNHPTVELQYILGEKVQIDREIAPMIRSIWQLDIRTSSSCQGDPGGDPAHLILPTQDLVRLLNMMSSLAPDDDDEEGDDLGFSKLYYRMAPWEHVTHEHPGRWSYQTSFYREAPGDCVRTDTMVEFPHEDIPVLEGILSRAVTFNRGDE